ncbi:MAG: 30S ribosomal protein S18 [Planctomycetes bacterium]|nr:30S ribosomal protein S18 [Planctomycetota bacterium]
MTESNSSNGGGQATTSTAGSASPGGGGPRRSRFGRFGQKRREVEPEEPLDYKNIAYLSKFVSPNGRILSRKRTGFSGQNQRKLALAIKNARIIGLMPFVGRA